MHSQQNIKIKKGTEEANTRSKIFCRTTTTRRRCGNPDNNRRN
jgi:hypothetical protein